MPSPQFLYQVSCPQPENHYFCVCLTIQNWSAPELELKMPVWTPGSYLIREYSRHLQDLRAEDGKGRAKPVVKLTKNHWRIDSADVAELKINYRVYADELSVRTNHLDASHGYFNGAALFLAVAGYEDYPLTLEISPPYPQWTVSAALEPETEGQFVYQIPNFDTLVDSPAEIGTQAIYDFTVRGKAHQLAVWGEGNLEPERLIPDLERIIETEAEIWGELPYERYLFLLHLSSQGYGGLEHRESCSLNYNRFGFREPEKYQRFLQLAAHEFFHLWNIKRLRPIALETFDYYQENYTPSLWFSEGATSYYDLLIPLRAKLYDVPTFLKNLSQELSRYRLTPGRLVQPLAESSFDAWIKLYRRESHSDNCQMSYYLKGELLTLMLDLLIRRRHDNQRSFDDVLRALWRRFGRSEKGFQEAELEAVISDIAGADLTSFWQDYLYGLRELPLEDYLEPFGLTIKPQYEDKAPYFGAKLQAEGGRVKVRFVAVGSPAEQAGLSCEDELLALNGFKIGAETFNQRLQDFQPQDWVKIAYFHQDRLQTVSVRLQAPRPSRYEVAPMPHPSPEQSALLRGWLEA